MTLLRLPARQLWPHTVPPSGTNSRLPLRRAQPISSIRWTAAARSLNDDWHQLPSGPALLGVGDYDHWGRIDVDAVGAVEMIRSLGDRHHTSHADRYVASCPGGNDVWGLGPRPGRS